LARNNELNWQNLVTIVSVMILIGTEVFGVALAGGWALAGLFELGEQVGYALMGVFSLGAAYLMWILWRSSVAVEPIRGR
jgi:threonine/homoserine/homoserine lactone efflux protein